MMISAECTQGISKRDAHAKSCLYIQGIFQLHEYQYQHYRHVSCAKGKIPTLSYECLRFTTNIRVVSASAVGVSENFGVILLDNSI